MTSATTARWRPVDCPCRQPECACSRLADGPEAPSSWTRERGRRVAAAQVLDDICRGEVILDEFGNDALAGDQVGHGHVRHRDDALGDSISERGDAVDHHEGIADESGFDGGGSAGHDRGAGVEERGAGVV